MHISVPPERWKGPTHYTSPSSPKSRSSCCLPCTQQCSSISGSQHGRNCCAVPKGHTGAWAALATKVLLQRGGREREKQCLLLLPAVQGDSEHSWATWISFRNLKVHVITHVLSYISLWFVPFSEKQMNLCSRFTQRHNDPCQPDTDEHAEHQ